MMRVCATLVAAAIALQPAGPATGALAYVSCERDGVISVVDVDGARVVRTIRTGHRPRGLQIVRGRLFVALSDASERQQRSGDAIVEYDIAGGHVAGRYDAGSDPERLAVSRDGRFLFAANEDAGTATITDTRERRVLATLTVGIEPEGIAISPDERWVYVTAETSNTVSVIDTRRREVAGSFLVDPRPRAASFSPDGTRAYITSEIGGSISVVDTSTHRVVEVIDLPPGAKPVGVAVSPDGRHVYVANGHGNSMSEIDAATLKVTRVIATGRRPWGVAVTPDGRSALTANGLSNDVSIVDLASGRVRTAKVGAGPWDVAIGR